MNKRITSFLKNKIVLATAVVAATIGLAGAATVAQFGPDRPTKAYTQGIKGFDHVTFNSFTGVPNIGDERNFLTGKIDQAPDGFYDPMNQVRDGNEILVRVYVHNNADESKNASGAGVAKNVKVRAEVPTKLASAQQTKAYISADNAQPKEIYDTLDINANYPFELDYIEGSAKMDSNFVNDLPLSDNIVKDGVLIGDDKLDGNMNGCFKYVALITYKVKVKAPNFTMQKSVRLNGEDKSKWREEAVAKPGDTVEWKLEFKNTGKTQLNDVDIFDQMPNKLKIVPNTTMIYNSKFPSGVNAGSDNVVKNGIDVGDYAANSNSIVIFKAKVVDLKDLECGKNTIVNKGYAKPKDHNIVTDNAQVVVTKECDEPKKPSYSCDLLKAEKLGGRKVKFTASASATNGAKVQRYIYNFGDGSQELTTDKNVVEHTYGKNGTFNAKVRVQVSVDNSTKLVEGPNCETPITFTTTPTTPQTPTTPGKLPETGAGSIIATFLAVTGLGTLGFHLLSRRFARF